MFYPPWRCKSHFQLDMLGKRNMSPPQKYKSHFQLDIIGKRNVFYLPPTPIHKLQCFDRNFLDTGLGFASQRIFLRKTNNNKNASPRRALNPPPHRKKSIPVSVADPGFPVGGVNLRRRFFLVKMPTKMKEFGPAGGVRPARPNLDPPMGILVI